MWDIEGRGEGGGGGGDTLRVPRETCCVMFMWRGPDLLEASLEVS